MSMNPTRSYTNWKFSEDNQLIGTVVSMQYVQAREYNPSQNGPGKPRVWSDTGKPVWNCRIGLATPEGDIKTFTFAKAGKDQIARKKPSVHMQLFDLSNNNVDSLMGKTLQITTWPTNPNTGQAWGQGNPRLFDVQIIPDVTYLPNIPVPEELLIPELAANDGASGGQINAPAPAQVATPVVTQPVMQPVVQPVTQPVMQMTAQQVAQSVMQPVATAPTPEGMDPAVAAAMQAVGATNVQPVTPYDEEIPF